MEYVAVFNALVAIGAPVAIGIRIAMLSDQYTEIRTGGDYSTVWWSLAAGVVVWIVGVIVTVASRSAPDGRTRTRWVTSWTLLQLALVGVAVVLAPGAPWS
ncbi:MAG: hypothetical protein U0Q22_17445 [Acidimicrobiales bacterium]